MRGLRLFIRPIESGDAPAVTEFLTRHREPGTDQTHLPASPAWGLLGKLLGDIVTVVGLEINANHLRAVREGTVTGTARALHVGRSTHVWEIRIENEAGKPVCISRITLAVVPAG